MIKNNAYKKKTPRVSIPQFNKAPPFVSLMRGNETSEWTRGRQTSVVHTGILHETNSRVVEWCRRRRRISERVDDDSATPRRQLRLETHGVTHHVAAGLQSLGGDALSEADGGDAARLRADDVTRASFTRGDGLL